MEGIGYTGRHHLFFEMLGHFMFYSSREYECKNEFINFAYNYLTQIIGLDKNRIFATIHPEDTISQNIWKRIGNSNLILNDNNFFVSPYAEKSALRTEILWQKNDEQKTLVELWNLVFTQFNSKNLFQNPSEFIAADSGASLERIVTAYENKANNYDNSMWSEYIYNVQQISLNSTADIVLLRRVADFTNTSVRLINEGIKPGNKVQPYMLRKILRTLFEMCDECEVDIQKILELYVSHNTLAITKEELIFTVIEEKKKYLTAIANGLKQAKKEIEKKGINNIDISYFKATCGLPQKYIDILLSTDKGYQLIKK